MNAVIRYSLLIGVCSASGCGGFLAADKEHKGTPTDDSRLVNGMTMKVEPLHYLPDGRLALLHTLLREKPGWWLLGPRSEVTITFLDEQDNAIKQQTVSITLSQDFLRSRAASSETVIAVSVPSGAKSLVAQFGDSRLMTIKTAFPHRPEKKSEEKRRNS